MSIKDENSINISKIAMLSLKNTSRYCKVKFIFYLFEKKAFLNVK